MHIFKHELVRGIDAEVDKMFRIVMTKINLDNMAVYMCFKSRKVRAWFS